MQGGNWLLCRIVVAAAATGPFWRKELIERLEAGEKAMGQPCMCGRYGTGEGRERPDQTSIYSGLLAVYVWESMFRIRLSLSCPAP